MRPISQRFTPHSTHTNTHKYTYIWTHLPTSVFDKSWRYMSKLEWVFFDFGLSYCLSKNNKNHHSWRVTHTMWHRKLRFDLIWFDPIRYLPLSLFITSACWAHSSFLYWCKCMEFILNRCVVRHTYAHTWCKYIERLCHNESLHAFACRAHNAAHIQQLYASDSTLGEHESSAKCRGIHANISHVFDYCCVKNAICHHNKHIQNIYFFGYYTFCFNKFHQQMRLFCSWTRSKRRI